MLEWGGFVFDANTVPMLASGSKEHQINKVNCHFYLNYLQGSCMTQQQDHGGQQTTPWDKCGIRLFWCTSQKKKILNLKKKKQECYWEV